MLRSRTAAAFGAAILAISTIGVTQASAASPVAGIVCTGVSGQGNGLGFYGCSGNSDTVSQTLTVATLGGGGTITWGCAPCAITVLNKPVVTVSRGACGVDPNQTISIWSYRGTVAYDQTGSAPAGGTWKASICVDAYRGTVTMPAGMVATFK